MANYNLEHQNGQVFLVSQAHKYKKVMKNLFGLLNWGFSRDWVAPLALSLEQTKQCMNVSAETSGWKVGKMSHRGTTSQHPWSVGQRWISSWPAGCKALGDCSQGEMETQINQTSPFVEGPLTGTDRAWRRSFPFFSLPLRPIWFYNGILSSVNVGNAVWTKQKVQL